MWVYLRAKFEVSNITQNEPLKSPPRLGLKNSIFGRFRAKMRVQVGSKMAKKTIFIPAMSFATRFSLKPKFLRAIVS